MATRGVPYVLRIAALYATLERRREITLEDIRAATEVWRYSVESARAIFGEYGDPTERARILAAVRRSPAGRLRRTEVRALLGGRSSAPALDTLRESLVAEGTLRIERERESRRGRPTEWWVAREKADGAEPAEEILEDA